MYATINTIMYYAVFGLGFAIVGSAVACMLWGMASMILDALHIKVYADRQGIYWAIGVMHDAFAFELGFGKHVIALMMVIGDYWHNYCLDY